MGKNIKGDVSATEAALVNDMVTSETERLAQEAPETEEEGAEGETPETAPATSAILTPAELDAKEDERKGGLLAEADKLLTKMKAAVVKAEGQYALTWLTIGGQSITYVQKRMEAGHSFNAGCDHIKLALGGYSSYTMRVDALQRAFSVWDSYCTAKGIQGDEKACDRIARAIPWRTWFNVLASLVSVSMSKDNTFAYNLLPYVADEIVTLIEGTVREGWSYDDVEDKARCIRGRSAEKVKEDAEAKADEARKVKEVEEAIRKAAQAAKDKADLEERQKAAQAKQAEQQTQEAQERLVKAIETATNASDENGSSEEDVLAAMAAQEQAAKDVEASKRAAQVLKEQQESARQEKERQDKAQKEAAQRVKDAGANLTAIEKKKTEAETTLKKVADAQDRKDSDNSGKGREKDKGPNLLTLAKTAAPADLASTMFAMLSNAPMPATVFAAFVALLNKDGLKIFKDDMNARNAIAAMAEAYEAK